jgi:chaperone BCS1
MLTQCYQLQGYLLSHWNDPTTAVQKIGEWVEQEKSKMEEAKQRAKEAAEWRAKKRKQKVVDLLAVKLEEVVVDEEKDEKRENTADPVKTDSDVDTTVEVAEADLKVET